MGLSPEKKLEVKDTIKNCLLNKFKNYKPETANMPFHYRLLGKDRMALFSFIQSLNTTFGTSIYEPVAIKLAEGRYKSAICQKRPHSYVSVDSQRIIQEIMDNITTATVEPNKAREIFEIRKVCQSGGLRQVKLRNYDIFLEDIQGNIICMDIKTVKPNIGGFEDYKRMLLTWAAAEMANNPKIEIKTMIAIPFNPYEPKKYNRWTMRGVFDLSNEVLVAEEMWDLIGGPGSYEDLLDCFEDAGIELRPEIDEYFSHF